MKEKILYALGFFDGVHLGHQALLTACIHLAGRTGCQPGAVTFAEHPQSLLSEGAPRLLNTIEDRQRLLCGYGIGHVLVLPFDRALRQLPWQDFLEMLLEKGAAGFVCGDDFRFGYQGQGNARLLAQFCQNRGLPYAVVPEQSVDGIRVSSTHIRGLIEDGQMEEAARFLGHPHLLTAQVVSGRQLGRTIGVPTANLRLPEGVVTPKLGVYACMAVADGHQYPAVTNVGHRPTVGGRGITVEPWILDFEGDLYGKHITLHFHKFLRKEKKFPNLQQLQKEIHKNAEETKKFLGFL